MRARRRVCVCQSYIMPSYSALDNIGGRRAPPGYDPSAQGQGQGQMAMAVIPPSLPPSLPAVLARGRRVVPPARYCVSLLSALGVSTVVLCHYSRWAAHSVATLRRIDPSADLQRVSVHIKATVAHSCSRPLCSQCADPAQRTATFCPHWSAVDRIVSSPSACASSLSVRRCQHCTDRPQRMTFHRIAACDGPVVAYRRLRVVRCRAPAWERWARARRARRGRCQWATSARRSNRTCRRRPRRMSRLPQSSTSRCSSSARRCCSRSCRPRRPQRRRRQTTPRNSTRSSEGSR